MTLLLGLILPGSLFADFSETESFGGGNPEGWSAAWVTNNSSSPPAGGGDLQTGTSTPSGSTGPQTAPTGSFLYYEASSGAGPDRFLTHVAAFDLAAESVTVDFQANMYGSNMGTLEVQIDTDSGFGAPVTVWTRSGDQGTAWFPVSIDLSSYSGLYYLRFRFVLGSGFRSDHAIDEINITGVSKCSATAPSDLSAPTVTGASVHLTWTADLVSNDLGYDVYRNGSLIASAVMGGSYTDNTVTPSTTYNAPGYQVMGRAACGDSPLSAGLPVTTPAIVNDTTPGAMTFPSTGPTTISLEVAFTGDDNGNNGCVITWGTDGVLYPNTAPAPTRTTGKYATTVGGLSKATAYYFRATFSDGDGVNPTNPVEATASTTDILLMHNSANLGTKYGTWGVSGGTYGAFTCATCHEANPANGNIKRLRTNIQATGTISGRAVTATGTVEASYGADNTTHATSDKVCEVCHSAVSVHKYNQSPAVAHYGNDCTSCHKHKTSFRPPTDCTLCHDVNATTAPTAPKVVDIAGGAVKGVAYGAHLKALKTDAIDGTTDWEAQCQKCHGMHDGTVLIPNNPTVGIDYSHGGIWIGGTSTTATTEAEICWECHDNATNAVSEWGVNAGTGSTYDYGNLTGTSNWVGAVWNSANFTYKSGNILSTHTANPQALGGPASTANHGQANPDTVDQIRCSYCHDVHNTAGDYGVIADVNGAPYLRGSWKGNPYLEDGAPRDTHTFTSINLFGAVPRGGAAQNALGGFQIDQNNGNPTTGWVAGGATGFGGLCELCHGNGDGTFAAAEINSLNQFGTASNDWVGTNGHANSVLGGSGAGAANIFSTTDRNPAGVTLNSNNDGTSAGQPSMAYQQVSYDYNTSTDYTGNRGFGFRSSTAEPDGWNLNPRTTNRYAHDAYDWGASADAATLDTAYHKFSCSKCHNPHASRLPRLMITNCLDTNHNTWDTKAGVDMIPAQGTVNADGSGNVGADNGSLPFSSATSAQNCHRVADPQYTNSTGAGWNTVTPWQEF